MKRAILWLPFVTGIVATSAHICCSQLNEILSSKVSFPGDPAYTVTEDSYWSIQEETLQPACIVHPSNANDVTRTVAIISQARDCEFAIKGQGHAPAAGFANVDGGVTIDMTGLNTTELNGDKSVASVGAGAPWLSVYQYLDQYNVSVAGGRNGLVGVGGLLVGGGISHFSPRVGWACDNVINFEVVLAGGVLTNANATSNPRLYRALKGGANNFAVVTRFDLAAFPQGAVSTTSIVNDISQRAAVFQAFTDIVNSPHFDIYTSLVTGFLYNSTSKAWVISNSAVYTKPVTSPPVFAELSSVPSISNSSKIKTLSELADEEATPPLNWLFATATFKTSTNLMLDIFDTLNSTLYSVNPAGGVVWSIAFEPLPSIMLSYAKKRGGNVLGLDESEGNSFIILISALWPNSASDEVVYEASRIAVSGIQKLAQSEGQLRKFEYLNYAAPYQDPLESYGSSNHNFLKEVSEEYDPSKLFQSEISGGFKLR